VQRNAVVQQLNYVCDSILTTVSKDVIGKTLKVSEQGTCVTKASLNLIETQEFECD